MIGQDSLQRPSGEAFVTFASVEDCMEGLRYHMRHLGKRYIEIFPLFSKEYYRKCRVIDWISVLIHRCNLLLDLQQVWTYERDVYSSTGINFGELLYIEITCNDRVMDMTVSSTCKQMDERTSKQASKQTNRGMCA